MEDKNKQGEGYVSPIRLMSDSKVNTKCLPVCGKNTGRESAERYS